MKHLTLCVSPVQTAGEVIQMGELQAEVPRKMWVASPACKALNMRQGAELQEAELWELTHQPGTESLSKNTFSSPG